jgi:hypothetical protein
MDRPERPRRIWRSQSEPAVSPTWTAPWRRTPRGSPSECSDSLCIGWPCRPATDQARLHRVLRYRSVWGTPGCRPPSCPNPDPSPNWDPSSTKNSIPSFPAPSTRSTAEPDSPSLHPSRWRSSSRLHPSRWRIRTKTPIPNPGPNTTDCRRHSRPRDGSSPRTCRDHTSIDRSSSRDSRPGVPRRKNRRWRWG